ncbi:MAG: hypothetical protein HYX72_15380 [Acidobacteria bacterium]|nr:hypothetical protein [Acidobacteriota bacterium]
MSKDFKTWIRSFVDIRPGEGRIAALLFAYYLLVIFAYYILKPVARALFLDKFDADKLPYLYILMALLGGGGASWIAASAMRERLTSVIGKSQIFLVGNILLIWWLLRYQSGVVLYIFSLWVGTFSVITVGQFWLLTNNLLDARTARRLFPLVGVAAVIGGTLGGTITSVLVRYIETRHLMLVCGSLVALTGVVVRVLRQYEEPDKRHVIEREEKHRTRDDLSLVWESAHLRTISLLVGIMFIVDTLVDYQFSVVAKQTYSGPQLTGFLARFQGIYLNLLSFCLQLFLTRPVLRLFGVGGALGFAPAGVALAGAALFIYPSLWAASVMRAVEAASRYTFTRTGMEMLYLPVARAVKNRTKVFLEVFVDRFSRGTAGGLLLLCTVVLHFNVRGITVLTLCFVAAWALVVTFVLRSYVGTLRKSLERRELYPESVTVQPWDTASARLLVESLSSPNERQVAYALQLLEQTPQVPISKCLPSLLKHSSPQVRAATFRLLASRRDAVAISEAMTAIHDPDEQIRAKSVNYICQCDSNPESRLESFLKQPDVAVRRAALDAVEQDSFVRRLRVISSSWIDDLVSGASATRETRALAARALTFADSASVPVQQYLESLIRDSDPVVANAAISSAGNLRKQELIPLLVQNLAKRSTRAEARDALVAFGPQLVPELAACLGNSAEPDSAREQIARILGRIGTREAADVLVRYLLDSSLRVRFRILKALSRIRRAHPHLQLPGDVIDQQLVNEARHYYELLLAIEADTNANTAGRKLLIRSLEQRLDQTLERIFHLLGLRYPPEDIFDAYRAIRNPQSQRRAAALEFLDNTLGQPAKRMILPILEDSSCEYLEPVGKELFGLEAGTCEDCLRQLINGQDRWLRVLAVYRASELQIASLEPFVRAAQSDSDPVVAETGAEAARRMHLAA